MVSIPGARTRASAALRHQRCAKVAEVDGLYTGQVIYCDEHAAVLEDARQRVTIHRFDLPVLPTPRGEYLELRRIDGRYEVSRDRGRRWKWLELDRAQALQVSSRNGVTAELAVRRPRPDRLTRDGPSDARCHVPRQDFGRDPAPRPPAGRSDEGCCALHQGLWARAAAPATRSR